MELKQLIEELEPALVILDPLARFAPADSESDPYAATRLIECLEELARTGNKPAVLAAHHTRKQPSQAAPNSRLQAADVRGSSALVDGARWVAGLESLPLPEQPAGLIAPSSIDKLAGLVRLSVLKSNVGHIPEPFTAGRSRTGGLAALTEEQKQTVASWQASKKPNGAAEKQSKKGNNKEWALPK
jgi:hypothetical protein